MILGVMILAGCERQTAETSPTPTNSPDSQQTLTNTAIANWNNTNNPATTNH
jgi:hypothetical protein